MTFKNKVALITGSTSGIGRGMAEALLQEGAKVIVNYSKNEEWANETKTLFKPYGEQVCYIKADVSDEKQVEVMYQKIDEKFQRLDYVINNAAYDVMASIEDFKLSDFRREIDVNLIGRFIIIQKAIPLLKKSETPRIINIASRLGTKPMLDSSAYCMTEAATIMLTKVCALELSKYAIKVNTISPSLTLTPLARQSYTEAEIEASAKKNPSHRVGKIEDTVNLMKFLLKEESEYINGENINVNGGILLV
ncbi:MAG: SDR family NAD(P)-dependent oxidoreductase [Clostridia bacterium]